MGGTVIWNSGFFSFGIPEASSSSESQKASTTQVVTYRRSRADASGPRGTRRRAAQTGVLKQGQTGSTTRDERNCMQKKSGQPKKGKDVGTGGVYFCPGRSG